MADLSEHFSKKDFACNCKYCKGSFKISLTLVGVLELIRTHFNKRVEVVNAYRCPQFSEEKASTRKSYHARGQAADIKVLGIPLNKIFLFAETIPQVNGIGLYPEKNFVHIDVREQDKKDKWVYEKNDYLELTDYRRKQYELINESQQ